LDRISHPHHVSTTPRCLPPGKSPFTGPFRCTLCAEGVSVQCDRETDESMANYHYYQRRIRRLVSQSPIQILLVCCLLFFAIRWVLQHNHDDDDGNRAPIARPVKKVEDPSIDWSKLYYAQYVTSAEYLCNALMVWSEIEDIGSRAQRQGDSQIYSSRANCP
jgi:hypothetical protein